MNCQYCDRICKNKNSLINHERLCKLNPSSQTTVSNFIKYNQLKRDNGLPGSNQFTKAKQLGISVETSDETRRKISDAFKGKPLSDSHRKNISESMKLAVKNNPDSYSASNINGRSKKIEYNGQILDSSWENEFARWCDDNKIKWKKNKKGFPYTWNGDRVYYPDFYLEELDRFVEVKGFERERDSIKWKAVPNLIVVKYSEIKSIRNRTYKI